MCIMKVSIFYFYFYQGGPVSVSYAVTVLEYCLMTGTDWWDVMLSLRPGMYLNYCCCCYC